MVRNYLKFIGFFILLSDECFGAEGGMPQLNPEYWVSQIFWVILIFGTLYVILWRTILPKINENLENRKSQILTDLDDAQKFEDQSKEKHSEYNKIINAITNPNSPVASAKAKPKSKFGNCFCAAEGLRIAPDK